jgi:hypothetical protein
MAPFAKKATTDEQRLRGMPTPRSTSVEARRRETETSTGDAFEFSVSIFPKARIGRCFRIDESRLHVEAEMALPPLDRHADETKREHRSAFRVGRFSKRLRFSRCANMPCQSSNAFSHAK